MFVLMCDGIGLTGDIHMIPFVHVDEWLVENQNKCTSNGRIKRRIQKRLINIYLLDRRGIIRKMWSSLKMNFGLTICVMASPLSRMQVFSGMFNEI